MISSQAMLIESKKEASYLNRSKKRTHKSKEVALYKFGLHHHGWHVKCCRM